MGKKLSMEEFVSYPKKTHFVYTEEDVLVPMMRLILERGGKQIHVKRIDSMLLCVEYVKKPKSSYSSLWVNGSYVTNFDSTASFGSDQRLTLGNIIDGDVPSLGTIAAMKIYTGITEGVSGPIKEEVMKALCRDYKVDIDSS